MRAHLPLALFTLAVLGCSGGSPAAPPAPASSPGPSGNNAPAPAPPSENNAAAQPPPAASFPHIAAAQPLGIDAEAPIESGESALGVFGLTIDRARMTASLEPLVTRQAQIGEDFEVDVTGFLKDSPCADCLQITGMSFEPGGEVAVDFNLVHPFAIPPPGGRLDLHAYDVNLQIFYKGTISDPEFASFATVDVQRSATSNVPLRVMRPRLLANADGYSAHLDQVIDNLYDTEATAHPYVLIKTEDTSLSTFDPDSTSGFSNLSNPQGFNVFGMGQTAQPRLLFDLPADQVSMLLVLDGRWGVSSSRTIPLGQPGSRNTPRIFLPLFNSKAAWRVTAEVQNNNLIDNSASSNAEVHVSVYDWQAAHGTVRAGFDPLTDPLDSIPEASGVAEVALSAPDLLASALTTAIPNSGTGAFTDPLLYTFLVSNSLLANDGDHLFAIAVRDDYRASGGRSNDGVQRDGVTFFDLLDYSTYQIGTLTVAPGNSPPACAIQATPPPPPPVPAGASIQFSGAPTVDDNDPNAALTWAWDIDYDGVTFIADGGYTTETINVPFSNSTAAVVPHTIAMRATDTESAFCDPPATIVVNVGPNLAPICGLVSTPGNGANIPSGQSVFFDATTTFDDQTPLAGLTFAWDLTYDNVTFVPTGGYTASSFNVDLFNPLTTPALRRVAVRATDAGGLSCVTAVQFTVAANQLPVPVITRPGAGVPLGSGLWNAGNPYPGATETIPIYLNRTQSADFSGVTSFDPDGIVVAHAWDFQNVVTDTAMVPDKGINFNVLNSTADPPAFAYTSYGSTFASLRVTDNAGAVAYRRREVVVTPWQPQIWLDSSGTINSILQHDFIANPISRRGNTVIVGNRVDPPGAVSSAFGTVLSSDGGLTWPLEAFVDNSANNDALYIAIDAGTGSNPYAFYMRSNSLPVANDRDLFYKRATNIVAANMWNPGTPGSTITTGAAAGYIATPPSLIDSVVTTGGTDSAVVGVQVPATSTTAGRIEFWRGTNIQTAPGTWTLLTLNYPYPANSFVAKEFDMAGDASGDIHVVVREDPFALPSRDRIRYAQFSPLGVGTNYGTQFIDSNIGTTGAIDPAIWVDVTGRPIVVWSSDSTPTPNSYGLNIWMRRGDSANVPTFGGFIQVNTDVTTFGRTPNSTRAQNYPSVCTDNVGRVWVVWDDLREVSHLATARREIYCKVYDTNLITVINEVQANNFDPHGFIDDRAPWITNDRVSPTATPVMTWLNGLAGTDLFASYPIIQ